MKISITIVEKMNPCSSRFNNFKEQYPNYKGELADFLALDNITYSDKVWVVTRLMTKTQKVLWSIACAESVKHHFENKYPDSKALSNLFTYLKSIKNYEELTQAERFEILRLRDAAYAAADAAANAADAAYAAYAAADAAYAADAAANAAAYAAAANAANAANANAAAAAYADAAAAAYAAAAAAAANAAKIVQQDLNLLLLVDIINQTKEQK